MTQRNTYAGQAFHPSFAGGKAAGSIMVGPSHIEFDHPQQSVQIPRQGAEFKLGGASDRLVFITHAAFADWTLYTSDRSILSDPQLAADPFIKSQLRVAKRKHAMNHGVLWAVLALIIVLPLLLLARMDTLTKLAVNQVPVEWERSLGESVFAQYQINEAMISDEIALQQLTRLAQPLLAAVSNAPFEFELHISESNELNAFALPGGIMVINAGLILAADSAEEVLGVVAHEIAHVTERHGIRNLLGAAGIYLIVQTVLGDVSGLFAVLVDAAPLLINQSYSRGFEAEADQQAIVLLQQAEIDPVGLIAFFEKMILREQEMQAKLDSENASAALETANTFLSSHPATQQRIESLQASLPMQAAPYRDLTPEFQQLKNTLKDLMINRTEDAP